MGSVSLDLDTSISVWGSEVKDYFVYFFTLISLDLHLSNRSGALKVRRKPVEIF